MDRRHFLGASAALLGAGMAGPAIAKPRRKWGLQLFTVIAALEQDFEGTLRKVAKLGYREVETIGSLGRDPKWLRAQFDRFGLASPSQHIAPDALYASFSAWSRKQITTEQNRENYDVQLALPRAIAAVRDGIAKAKVLGQRYVTWPNLMPQMLANTAILDGYIAMINEAGRIAHEEGMTFTFHNHAREFEMLDGQLIYDRILANTDPALVKMELDLYWITKAGKDARAYLAANPGRFFGCHVKDMDANGDFAPAGSGKLDLPGLIGAARKSGAQHFFVEIDRSDDPMGAATSSIRYLKTIG